MTAASHPEGSGGHVEDVEIVEVTAADTHVLRRAILRDGDPDRPVEYPEDCLPAARHLAARDGDGAIVAVSTWIPKQLDTSPDDAAVQLRGMATATSMQGRGIGSLLFETGVRLVASEGYDVMWARARDSAIGFYTAHGCTVIGDGFVDETTGLNHHVVVRRVAPP